MVLADGAEAEGSCPAHACGLQERMREGHTALTQAENPGSEQVKPARPVNLPLIASGRLRGNFDPVRGPTPASSPPGPLTRSRRTPTAEALQRRRFPATSARASQDSSAGTFATTGHFAEELLPQLPEPSRSPVSVQEGVSGRILTCAVSGFMSRGPDQQSLQLDHATRVRALLSVALNRWDHGL